MADLPELPALTDEQIDAAWKSMWPNLTLVRDDGDWQLMRRAFPRPTPPRPEDWDGGCARVYWVSALGGWSMHCDVHAAPEARREFLRRAALAVEWSDQTKGASRA
ncbi:hypothetical protein [Paraconexibacter algicola]|uniref:Uncharacterized protein n=1 Tax=Paraconexibacter algicola TaxID=2133960 RepID=A0A2T4UE45_9ACTN|nr:hypothetical protein [Paraconexibacter algicola]PTL55771.1 hypothetical protein C7Y72_19270 [Paraconexibacter algicola]